MYAGGGSKYFSSPILRLPENRPSSLLAHCFSY